MKKTIIPVMAALVLLLALACQQSDQDVGQLVDERITAALAVVPTITPQPTSTPHTGTASPTGTPGSGETINATIESLMGRLEAAESQLQAQDLKFRDLMIVLDNLAIIEVVEPGPPTVVTIASNSTTFTGRCWQYRLSVSGNGNTFLVEWEVEGNTESLCFNPSSICVEEVRIGEALPESCDA